MSDKPTPPTLLQNLRSRKLAQWLLAYAAGAWVLLQVLSLLIGAYHWPDSALRIAIGVAVLGFFITAVLAWYHGERGMQRATRAEVGLLALIVAIGSLGIWLGERGREAPTPTIAATAPVRPNVAGAIEKAAANSIAVLPFVNMSSDADNEFFSDGLSEEILNSLARIEGMQVVGRTSSFQFKGKNEDLRGIGEKLGVATLLEGSVRREGERARITAQLIRVSDGFHLWSETYDRTLQDTLAVQLDIAEKVAGALNVLLDDKQRTRMRKAGIGNVDAFIAYQKGLKLYFDAHGDPKIDLIDGLRLANAEFDKATALEPGFFEAHFAKVDLYEHTLQSDGRSQPERKQAQQAALATLALAAASSKDDQQRALTLAERQMLSDDWRGLAALIDESLKAPGCSASNWMPVFASAFGYADALDNLSARARVCDPLNQINANTRITVALATGHPQRALDVLADFEKTMRVPSGPLTRRAVALAMLGRSDAAAKELDAINPQAIPDSYYSARVVVSRAQGKSPAEIHASLKDIYGAPGKYSQWRVAEIVEAANAGDRAEANRLAAVMDARPAGPFLLAVMSTSCYCGAPFDIEATPNFKARLAESGLHWPPPPTIPYPSPGKEP
jgi:adenylate cyclase